MEQHPGRCHVAASRRPAAWITDSMLFTTVVRFRFRYGREMGPAGVVVGPTGVRYAIFDCTCAFGSQCPLSVARWGRVALSPRHLPTWYTDAGVVATAQLGLGHIDRSRMVTEMYGQLKLWCGRQHGRGGTCITLTTGGSCSAVLFCGQASKSRSSSSYREIHPVPFLHRNRGALLHANFAPST